MAAHGTETAFTGRVVIISGAGSGIGRAATLTFARAGAHVLGIGRRQHALDTTAGQHPNITVFTADLRAEGAADAIVQAATDRWGTVDALVNNAGVTAMMPLAETTESRISDLFRLNVTAPSLLAHAALPYLRQTRGAIVNLSSTYGHRPAPHFAHGATKAALEQLTRSWALELAADRIRVNAVAPGPTESEALAAAGLPADMVQQVKTRRSRAHPARTAR